MADLSYCSSCLSLSIGFSISRLRLPEVYCDCAPSKSSHRKINTRPVSGISRARRNKSSHLVPTRPTLYGSVEIFYVRDLYFSDVTWRITTSKDTSIYRWWHLTRNFGRHSIYCNRFWSCASSSCLSCSIPCLKAYLLLVKAILRVK